MSLQGVANIDATGSFVWNRETKRLRGMEEHDTRESEGDSNCIEKCHITILLSHLLEKHVYVGMISKQCVITYPRVTISVITNVRFAVLSRKNANLVKPSRIVTPMRGQFSSSRYVREVTSSIC